LETGCKTDTWKEEKDEPHRHLPLEKWVELEGGFGKICHIVWD
jgi:hypothetical protein